MAAATGQRDASHRWKRFWMLGLVAILLVAAILFLVTRPGDDSTHARLACEGTASARGFGLVKNGGFEHPLAPTGGYVTFAPGQKFAGWTVIGTTGGVSPLSGEYNSGGVKFKAYTGRQTLDLTGVSALPTGVSQRVPTKAGKSYGLSFWTGNAYTPGGAWGSTTATKVRINGRPVLTARNNGRAETSTLNWKHFCIPFTAKSGSTAIAFVNGDPTTDNSDILDDVSVR